MTPSALTHELRAILAEIKPTGNHEHREFPDELLALGIWLERKVAGLESVLRIIVAADNAKITRCPTRHADGSEPGPTARSTRKARRAE